MNDDFDSASPQSKLEQIMLTLANKRQAHPLPEVRTEAQSPIPQLPMLDRLAKAIRALGNPTAGAEIPNQSDPSLVPFPPLDRDQAGNEIKQTFRNTTDPNERARIQRRVARG